MEPRFETSPFVLDNTLQFPGQAIEGWLIQRVAALAQLDGEQIDVTQPFSYYALDSVATVGLSAELEDLLGVRLPATLVWDYPTIAALAEYLAGVEPRS